MMKKETIKYLQDYSWAWFILIVTILALIYFQIKGENTPEPERTPLYIECNDSGCFDVYATGVYVNCTINNDTLDDSYLNWAIEGVIVKSAEYRVGLDILKYISNSTGLPIVCGKVDADHEYGINYVEGIRCAEPPPPFDIRHQRYKILCCVAGYCYMHDNYVNEWIQCGCDDSLVGEAQ